MKNPAFIHGTRKNIEPFANYPFVTGDRYDGRKEAKRVCILYNEGLQG